MTISGVAAVGGASTSGSSVEAQIARLRKQELDLNKQLQELATSDDDAKTKQTKQELLSAQIQVIEAQIAQLLARQAEAVQQAAAAKQAATQKGTTQQDGDGNRAAAVSRPAEGMGNALDVAL